jgi:hypothetical protein
VMITAHLKALGLTSGQECGIGQQPRINLSIAHSAELVEKVAPQKRIVSDNN